MLRAIAVIFWCSAPTGIIDFKCQQCILRLVSCPLHSQTYLFQVSLTGKLSLADRYGLMAAIFEEDLADDKQTSIDRLLRAVYRGRLLMVDEISTVSSKRYDSEDLT